METPVSLQYPNGRVHDTPLDRDLFVGEQFELYGRTWTAVRTKSERRYRVSVSRIVCVSTEAAPRTEKRPAVSQDAAASASAPS
jgi:hypothetical protein